jgi:hypothetical protein
MSATNTTVPASTSTTSSLVGTGVVTAVLASGITTIVAAAGSAAGISLDVGGEAIPVPGFAVLTAFFSLVGLVLAVVMSRKASRARSTFIRTTAALTVLSLVPDVIVDATPATKALLMLTHVVAAAIVIPAVARRLTV